MPAGAFDPRQTARFISTVSGMKHCAFGAAKQLAGVHAAVLNSGFSELT
jgi:hypothetical protein